MALEFASTNGSITCNGKRVRIKGTNWFGLETDVYSLHGLWSVSFDSVLGFLSDNDFNAVRIPVSVELVEKMTTDRIKSINGSANPDLVDMTIEAFLDHVFKKCATKGILVMLDMHLLKASASIPELWYSADFPEERSIAAWRALVTRYQRHWNFFACDLKNEPHGAATWGDGAATDWRAAAERIGNAILALCPRMLIFVEGIDGRDMDDSWWGGYLALAHPDKHPVRLNVANRLVYSPHVYGPDVFDKDMFKTKTFPRNMPEYWHRQWAFLELDVKGAAVCLGEWGGKAQPDSRDLTWQRALAEYLGTNNIRDSFYWCVNPNSGDTGGLLAEDWKTPVAAKLQLINVACPAPTSFLGGKPSTPPVPPLVLPWPSLLGGPTPGPTPPNPGPTPPAPGPTPPKPGPTPPKPGPTPPKPGPTPPKPGPTPPKPGPTPPAPGPTPPTPTGITATASITNSWKEGSVEHQQYDVVVTNTSAAEAAGAKLRVNIAAAKVVNIWNVDDVGGGAYKLPGWLLDAGGLKPGASFKFGCITSGKPAVFQISFAK